MVETLIPQCMGSVNDKESLTFGARMHDQSEPDVEKLLKRCATFGDVFRSYYAIKLRDAFSGQPATIRETILNNFLRFFEPWPDWVLRIAAEVDGVYAPTISKTLLYDCFRLIHTFFFELRLDGTSPRESVSIPKIDASTLGAGMGHAFVVAQVVERQALELAQAGVLSPEKLLEYQTRAKPPEALKKALTNYIDARSLSDFIEFSNALANARARTLDKRGQFRTTTATDVYAAILSDWPTVETMTGPTELCTFLSSRLVGSQNDPAFKLDRIKKICRRMGIKFKGRKGTSPGLSLSL